MIILVQRKINIGVIRRLKNFFSGQAAKDFLNEHEKLPIAQQICLFIARQFGIDPYIR
jgi:hypothetical protein